MKRKLALALAMMMGISSLSVTAFAADDSLEDTGKLTLYYSNSTEWADPIIQEFEDQTGIEVSLVQDGTSSLFARIKAEAGNPQADVVWGGVIDTYRANQDLLQEYTSSEVDSLKPEAVDPNGYYTGFDMGPMVMIYNTELVPEDEAPTKWSDLLDEKYKGQIACADPTSSSSSFACIMSIILAYGTEDGKGYDFVEDLVHNLDGKVLSSSSGVYKGVSDGEYMVGLTYEEAALRYIESGANIQVVYPEEGLGFGIMGAFIPSEAPNKEAANQFLNYILEPENAAKCMDYIGYYNTIKAADDLVDPNLVVPDSVSKGEIIQNVSAEADEAYNKNWTEFKAACGQ